MNTTLLSSLLKLISAILLLTAVVLLYDAFGDKMVPMRLRGEVQQLPEGFEQTAYGDVDSNGIHRATGLKYGPGIFTVQRNCLACHSSKLITQNRATRDGWQQTIRWMQRTQGLWDLDRDEGIILDYLATYYAPEETGRRANLDAQAIQWYTLEPE